MNKKTDFRKNKKQVYNKKSVASKSGEMSENRKKAYALILAVLIVFWTVASVLGTIGFVRSSAEADTTLTRNEVTDDGYVVNLAGMDGAFFTDGAGASKAVMNDTISIRFEKQAEVFTVFSQNGSLSLSIDAVSSNQQRVLTNVGFYDIDEYVEYDLYITFNASSWNAFNGVPYRASYQKNATDSVTVWIDYADRDGNIVSTLSMNFDFSPVGWNYVYLPIWNNALEWTAGMYADEIFTLYDYQQNGGYINGYEDGKQAGRADGYGAGYQAGIAEAGDYTFMSLISAVIDAPIQAFMGLFNFELLGVDMAGFFLSLLTVCAIIAVIKLFL